MMILPKMESNMVRYIIYSASNVHSTYDYFSGLNKLAIFLTKETKRKGT